MRNIQFNNYCKNCGFCGQAPDGSKGCLLTNKPVGDEDFCSKFSTAPCHCDKCNRIVDGAIFLPETKELVCGECYEKIGTCGFCSKNNYCAFQMDRSCQEPPQIQQQVRQGNMTFATIVKNPKRVEQTCAKGCACFSNGTCMREVGKCCNYS